MSFVSKLLPLAGTAIGAYFGGPVGAAIGGSIGSALSSDAAGNDAVQAQADAAAKADATQRYFFDTNRADNAPLLASRNSALDQINALLKDPASLSSAPDYQFGLDQGSRALNSGAAARGMTYSGAQGKALQRYGQDYAGTKLNESYNRLSNIAGLGQVATNSNTMAGQNAANQISGNQIGVGNATAANTLYTNSAYQNALNQGLGAWMRSPSTNNNLNIWQPGYDDTSGSTGGWTGQH